MEKKVMSPAAKGLLLSLVLIVFALVVQFSGQERNKLLGLIQMLLYMGGIVYSVIAYTKEMDGFVTFGNAFVHGFKVAAAVTAIMVVFSIISIKYINPEALEMGLREARTSMEKNSQLSDDQIETSLNFTRKFFVPLTAGTILFIYLLTGLLAALIGAGVAKKRPADPFANPQV